MAVGLLHCRPIVYTSVGLLCIRVSDYWTVELFEFSLLGVIKSYNLLM